MWPTATVHGERNRKRAGSKSGDGLRTAVLWPTATARDPKGVDAIHRQGGMSLCSAVRAWATPGARDDRGPAGSGYVERGAKTQLPNQVGATGKLNAHWVEMLMGFPANWTRIDGLPGVVKPSTDGNRRARSKGATRNGARG